MKMLIAVFVIAVNVVGCSTISTQKLLHSNSPLYHGDEQYRICWNAKHSTYNRPQPIIYSGAWFDTHYMILGPFTCSGEECWGAWLFYPLSLPLGIIDLPLSLAADTVLLPYTMHIKTSRCKDYRDDNGSK